MDRSALKKAYKEARQPMGVYRITTSQSDKIYIGTSANLPAKLNRHQAELKFGSHRNKELQAIWNKFGKTAFTFEILDELDQEKSLSSKPEDELLVLADMWVQKLEEEGATIVRL